MEIKPIETIYNGYRFRSRLEARWAVFFDACHIEYQYEPQGYVLHDGRRYLPDFYLPQFEIFVEIKPSGFDKDSKRKWENTCSMFRDSTDMAILLCTGEPAESLYKILFAWDTTDSSGGPSEYDCLFVEFRDQIVLCTEPTRSDRTIYVRGFSTTPALWDNDRVGTPHQFTGDRDLLWERAFHVLDPEHPRGFFDKACLKARQARFEHGEKPTT